MCWTDLVQLGFYPYFFESYQMRIAAPGIWQLTLGTPEEHTPTKHHAFEPCLDALDQMPQVDAIPVALDLITSRQTARGFEIEFPIDSADELYGLGLQLKSHRQTGMKKTLAVNSDPVADTGDSHAPVPVLISTGGWAIFVDTLRYATFHCASHQKVGASKSASEEKIAINTEDLYAQRQLDQKHVTIEIPHAQGADIYFIAGPQMKDAVERYNLFSGGGCMPSLWGLGVWYRAFGRFDQQQVLNMAKHLRDRNMPCDVLGLEPGWQTKAYSCSFVWAEDRFPDTQKMIDDTKAQGYKLNLWEHAYTHPSSPMYEDLKPHSGDYEVWGGLVPDFTTKGAFDTFAKYHDQTLVSKGITGFKLDECDSSDFVYSDWGFPMISQFPSGMDGEQMHSLLGMKYMHCINSIFRDHNLRTYNSVRNAHALAAPYPFVLYSDLYDHRDFVRGVVNMGFTGLLWTPEVRHATSSEDLVRRIQAAMLSPQALINAWYISNPPWQQIDRDKNNANERMDDWESLEAHCRTALELRMKLVPYLYGAFAKYHFHGTPPFRAMVMDWPEDEQTFNLDDQYMMGDDLLVAPVFAGQDERKIYLPAGTWHDFYSRQTYQGGQTITIKPVLDQIPIYVKDNTLLPLAKPVQHIEPDTIFELTLHTFGDEPRDAVLFEDDGVSYADENNASQFVAVKPDGRIVRDEKNQTHRHVVVNNQ